MTSAGNGALQLTALAEPVVDGRGTPRPPAPGTRTAPALRDGPESVADRLADVLVRRLARGRGGTVTWLNHYSAMIAMKAGVPLDRFDYLGLDGIFLCRLLGLDATDYRTSADLVLPRLLERAPRLRIALIGSTPTKLRLVADKIVNDYGHEIALLRDGYEGLPDPRSLQAELHAAGVQVVILGLGTPLQDSYALDLSRQGLLVATCGGWLDQFSGEVAYYPSWAYPLKLNWLVRLVKEPHRLWRRYTVHAVRAVRSRRPLVDYVTGLGGRPLSAAAPTPSWHMASVG